MYGVCFSYSFCRSFFESRLEKRYFLKKNDFRVPSIWKWYFSSIIQNNYLNHIVQEMSPRVFNTNCTADVFMTFVKRIIIEEVGEYCVNKQGLLQAKIDELDMEIQNCELSITRFESTEGGILILF